MAGRRTRRSEPDQRPNAGCPREAGPHGPAKGLGRVAPVEPPEKVEDQDRVRRAAGIELESAAVSREGGLERLRPLEEVGLLAASEAEAGPERSRETGRPPEAFDHTGEKAPDRAPRLGGAAGGLGPEARGDDRRAIP